MRGLRKALNDSDFGIVDKKEIKKMADFVKNNNNGKRPANRKPNNARPNNRPPKDKDFGSKKESRIKAPDVCAGTIEYKMGKLMAEEIVKAAKNKKSPQEILCDYVNTQMGLKGYCVKVLVDIN